MEQVALVIAIVSAIAAVASAVIAVIYGRGQKRAADRSASAADRSAVEARRSADAAQETVQIERQRRADELVEAERRRVEFTLTFTGGNRYLLTNEGTNSAYNVHVDTQRRAPHGQVHEWPEFTDGMTESLLLSHSLNAPDHIVVSWHVERDGSDEPRTKKLHLG